MAEIDLKYEIPKDGRLSPDEVEELMAALPATLERLTVHRKRVPIRPTLSGVAYALGSTQSTAALLSRLPPALRVLQFGYGSHPFSPDVFAAPLPRQLTSLTLFGKTS